MLIPYVNVKGRSMLCARRFRMEPFDGLEFRNNKNCRGHGAADD